MYQSLTYLFGRASIRAADHSSKIDATEPSKGVAHVLFQRALAVSMDVVCEFKTVTRRVLPLVLIGLFSPLQDSWGQLPAFPGAEGFGAASEGGRGGRVIQVTNLDDSGSGSFRAALEASGRRVVVFTVAGDIRLRDSIFISDPFITIAGQTAPGDGITLRGDGIRGALVRVEDRVHDIIIRYIKFRLGKDSDEEDNITIRSASRVIIDHCSFEWGTDESIGLGPNQPGSSISDITIQRSIIAATLDPHSTGLLATKYEDGDRTMTRVSMHQNLFAHNSHRNPRVSAHAAVRTPPQVQFINNVVYNWNDRVGTTQGGVMVDLIGNYLRAGPWSRSGIDRVFRHEDAPKYDSSARLPAPSLYITGNIQEPNFTDPSRDNWDLLTYHYHRSGNLPSGWRRSQPIEANIAVTIQPVQVAFQSVLANVGGNGRRAADGSWVTNVDSVDQGILDDVRNGTGPSSDSEVNHEDDFGGYPRVNPGSPYEDRDADGMADTWETLNGFDPADDSDGPADADGDGYTNLEEFLNGTSAGGESRGHSPPGSFTVN